VKSIWHRLESEVDERLKTACRVVRQHTHSLAVCHDDGRPAVLFSGVENSRGAVVEKGSVWVHALAWASMQWMAYSLS
jgi:hypothetical protein